MRITSEMYTPKPGDIGLVTIPGGAGKLIRFGQWLNGDGFKNYEHAFVYIGSNRIVEAEPGGARIVAMHYRSDSVLWLKCPDEFSLAVAHAAKNLEGTPYSFLDYLALAMVRLHIPFAGAIRRFVRSTKHMICSQLANFAATAGGWHQYNDGRWPQDVTPGDLTRLALAQIGHSR